MVPYSIDPPVNTPTVRAVVVVQDVADVVVGVAGGVDGPQLDRSGVDDVAVADGAALVGDVVAGGDDVLGFGDAREFQAAGDVVVVDVGFQDVGDPHAALAGEVEDPVDVALGVDDHGDVPFGDQVAAVAESGGFDDGHVHGVSFSLSDRVVGMEAWLQLSWQKGGCRSGRRRRRRRRGRRTSAVGGWCRPCCRRAPR